MSSKSPFAQLLLARIREFTREPEVVFWVFGFPILLALGLGIAFRNKPPDRLEIGVVQGEGAVAIAAALRAAPSIDVREIAPGEAHDALRLGKVSLIVVPGSPREYRFDPTRPDCVLARQVADDVLQAAAGRKDPVVVRDEKVTAPGARYIDFLIPGLLGMNIMSGGMWGVGYALTEMRSRKLLKRLIATPMRRSDFLLAMMSSRMILVVLELVLLMFFGWLAFDMVIRGSFVAIVLLVVLGGFSFASLGLLVASRAKKIETITGLINLVTLPMFVLSGVFFSSARFPEFVQPLIRLLPLTALNDALRAVILEGADLRSQLLRLGVLVFWGGVSFVLALRMFRWN